MPENKTCEKCGFEYRTKIERGHRVKENVCYRCHYNRRAESCGLEKWELIEIIAQTYSTVSFVYFRQLGGNGFLKTNLKPEEMSDVKKELDDLMRLTNWAVRE